MTGLGTAQQTQICAFADLGSLAWSTALFLFFAQVRVLAVIIPLFGVLSDSCQ